MFGYKLFAADTIDDLTVEQYNMLVELYNVGAAASVQKADKWTTSIRSIKGKQGVDYGDD